MRLTIWALCFVLDLTETPFSANDVAGEVDFLPVRLLDLAGAVAATVAEGLPNDTSHSLSYRTTFC